MRWRLCAALLVCLVPLPAAAQDAVAAARVAIDACTASLDPQVDVGYERIAARCPNLARTLEQSGFAQWLPQGWKETRNNLSAGSLTELRVVIERETATRASPRVPRVERLGEVLDTLGGEHAQGSGAWLRFKKWLRDLMEKRDPAASENWFDRMMSRGGISDAVGEIITYVALAAVVVLALIVVLNELKAAGLLGRRSRERSKDDESGIPTAPAAPSLGEIQRAPMMERPGMLLGLISAKLTALRRLPPSSALTVHELTSSVELPDVQDRARLSALAITAERARYAQDGVPVTLLESSFDLGIELLKSVEALQATQPVREATP